MLLDMGVSDVDLLHGFSITAHVRMIDPGKAMICSFDKFRWGGRQQMQGCVSRRQGRALIERVRTMVWATINYLSLQLAPHPTEP